MLANQPPHPVPPVSPGERESRFLVFWCKVLDRGKVDVDRDTEMAPIIRLVSSDEGCRAQASKYGRWNDECSRIGDQRGGTERRRRIDEGGWSDGTCGIGRVLFRVAEAMSKMYEPIYTIRTSGYTNSREHKKEDKLMHGKLLLDSVDVVLLDTPNTVQNGQEDVDFHYDVLTLEGVVDAVGLCQWVMKPVAHGHLYSFCVTVWSAARNSVKSDRKRRARRWWWWRHGKQGRWGKERDSIQGRRFFVAVNLRCRYPFDQKFQSQSSSR